MKSSALLLAALLGGAAFAAGECSLTNKPILRAVTDAAALKSGIAPNALVSLFGQNFNSGQAGVSVGPGDLADGVYPKAFACIAVEVAGNRAPVSYVQPDQINAQMPTLTPIGKVNVQVIANPGTANELRSDPITITVQSFAPALFTYNGTSVAALNAVTAAIVANPSLFSSARPAKPGDYVAFYGTGLGFTNPVYQAGEISSTKVLAALPGTVTVSLNGVALPPGNVQYAGLSPGYISGLYQINILIPDSAPDGDDSLVVSIGGASSPAGVVLPVKR
jgi:uncharacterized protein (TIGR03437 family)